MSSKDLEFSLSSPKKCETNNADFAQIFENGLDNSGKTEVQLKRVTFYPWSQKKFNYYLENTENVNCKQDDCKFCYMTLENYDRNLSDLHCLASFCAFCSRERTSLRYLQKYVRKMHAVAESPFVVNELPLTIEEAEIAQDFENTDKRPKVFAKLNSLQNGFCCREVLLKCLRQLSSTWTQCLPFFVYSMLCFRRCNGFIEASFR